MHKDSELSDYIKDKIAKVVTRLANREPIQYIFGATTFGGRRFAVTHDTLIPRPETQELVDIIVERHRDRTDLRLLDIGTGSGCIAISLALSLRFPRVKGIDISQGALDVAIANAASLKARNADFDLADILTARPDPESYDIIVSNPPYITQSEAPTLDSNVIDYEPKTALFVPDNKPLLFYEAIARYAAVALVPEGYLYFEINNRYPEEMRRLLSDLGFTEVDILRDIHSLYRFAIARKPKA